MTLDEVKKFFDENKNNDEVKSFLGEFQKIAPEKEKEIIENYKRSSDYKKELQIEGDRRATGAIEKFQRETMPKHLEEEINKLFPAETKEQKEIRELSQKLERIENEKKNSEIREKAIKALTTKKLNPNFMEFIKANDEQDLEMQIDKLNEIYSASVLEEVDKRLKSSGVNPPITNNNAVQGKITDPKQLDDMSSAEITRAKNEGRIDIPGLKIERK